MYIQEVTAEVLHGWHSTVLPKSQAHAEPGQVDVVGVDIDIKKTVVLIDCHVTRLIAL
jgi:hypothetical protein